MGLDVADMQPHYDAVAARIGVCGARATTCCASSRPSPGMMPALEPTRTAESLLERYERQRAALNARRASTSGGRASPCARSRIAVAAAYAYYDLDFWADPGRSIYRPQWTLDELERRPDVHLPDALPRRGVRGGRAAGCASRRCTPTPARARRTRRARWCSRPGPSAPRASCCARSTATTRRVPLVRTLHVRADAQPGHARARRPRDRRSSQGAADRHARARRRGGGWSRRRCSRTARCSPSSS